MTLGTLYGGSLTLHHDWEGRVTARDRLLRVVKEFPELADPVFQMALHNCRNHFKSDFQPSAAASRQATGRSCERLVKDRKGTVTK